MAAAPPIETPDARAPSDDELMVRLDAGDVGCLAALQARYQDRVRLFVRGMLRDDHLAQDVTQEVFARVFLKSHLYAPGTNFRAWMFEIARNQARSALRTRRQLPTPVSSFHRDDDHGLIENLATSPPDRLAEERELMAAFRQAVARLPERYQVVFDLCMARGLEYREAARLLDVPVGTVAIRLMRARKRLYEALARHLGRLRRPPACVLPV